MNNPFTEDCLHIRWSALIPGAIPEVIEQAIEKGEKALEDIAAAGEKEPTFESTFVALEEATEDLDRAWSRVSHLDAVCNSDALREAYNAMLPKVSDFYAQIALRDDLWEALRQVTENIDYQELSPIQRRLMDETVKSFRRNGADLTAEKKARFQEVKRLLAERTQKYSENVLDATNAWELLIDDESRLSGMPTVAKETALASARKKGHGTEDKPVWRFTLHAPSMVPVLEYADDEALRRQIWEAYSRVGRQEPHVNTDLIREILDLRQKMAELLGEKHFANHVLEVRMAKDAETALEFVEDLHQRILPQFKREIDELERFKAAETGGSIERLQPWEVGYWSEKLRQKRYAFDAEALRPYFAIDRVIEGMFALVADLYGLRFVERQTAFFADPAEASIEDERVEVWHPEVKFYDVIDGDGDVLGSFYADWHPRESKRGGAWMNYLRTGTPPRASGHGRREPHIGLICANLTPASGGRQALLTHSEVETIFHEFGHLLHHLLGDVEYKSLNGVNVVWDFVELPSQIMENFCWERVSLDRFARHHETGKPIPEDLFARMTAARHFQSAMLTMRQLSLGKMDLELHIRASEMKDRDLDETIDMWLRDYVIPTKSPRPNNSHNFSHLFSSPTGYAAGYYSYKWAEVLDADAFTRFKEKGVVSAEVGAEFRQKILSQGNARDANELFRDFMGRDPELEPLLERSGLMVTG